MYRSIRKEDKKKTTLSWATAWFERSFIKRYFFFSFFDREYSNRWKECIVKSSTRGEMIILADCQILKLKGNHQIFRKKKHTAETKTISRVAASIRAILFQNLNTELSCFFINFSVYLYLFFLCFGFSFLKLSLNVFFFWKSFNNFLRLKITLNFSFFFFYF